MFSAKGVALGVRSVLNVRLQSSLMLFRQAALSPSLPAAEGRAAPLPGRSSSALLQGDVRHDGDEEAAAGQDLNQGVNRLMAAMRDMLANIQFQEPPRDDNPEGDGDWD